MQHFGCLLMLGDTISSKGTIDAFGMKLKPRDFFRERLGVGLKNTQWSWGAFDPASNRVFLRVWKDEIKSDAHAEKVVVLGKPDEFAGHDDPVMLLNRYQLYDYDESDLKTDATALRRRRGSGSITAGHKVVRRGTAATEYTPEHNSMQRKLLAELKNEFPSADIDAEKDYIDVSVETKTELLLF